MNAAAATNCHRLTSEFAELWAAEVLLTHRQWTQRKRISILWIRYVLVRRNEFFSFILIQSKALLRLAQRLKEDSQTDFGEEIWDLRIKCDTRVCGLTERLMTLALNWNTKLKVFVLIKILLRRAARTSKERFRYGNHKVNRKCRNQQRRSGNVRCMKTLCKIRRRVEK